MTLARNLLAIAALAMASGLSYAGNISWSIGINLPHVGTVISNAPAYHHPAPYHHPVEVPYYAPPPVIYRPAPVYYSPPVVYRSAPVYYSPPAVVYRQQPIYAGSPVYLVERGPRHRHWQHRGHDGHRGQVERRGGRRDRD